MTEALTEDRQNIPELIPVSLWNKYFPFPSVGSLRQYIFHGHKNGFNKVVRRMGTRQYIHVKAFYEWVDNNTGKRAC